MSKAQSDPTPGVVASRFGRVDPERNRDAGTFTADRRLYLDAGGRVVEHDDPAKVSLLVPAGGTLPLKRARDLGLLDGGDGGHTVPSRTATADTKAADTPDADTKAADAGTTTRPATTGRHGQQQSGQQGK